MIEGNKLTTHVASTLCVLASASFSAAQEFPPSAPRSEQEPGVTALVETIPGAPSPFDVTLQLSNALDNLEAIGARADKLGKHGSATGKTISPEEILKISHELRQQIDLMRSATIVVNRTTDELPPIQRQPREEEAPRAESSEKSPSSSYLSFWVAAGVWTCALLLRSRVIAAFVVPWYEKASNATSQILNTLNVPAPGDVFNLGGKFRQIDKSPGSPFELAVRGAVFLEIGLAGLAEQTGAISPLLDQTRSNVTLLRQCISFYGVHPSLNKKPSSPELERTVDLIQTLREKATQRVRELDMRERSIDAKARELGQREFDTLIQGAAETIAKNEEHLTALVGQIDERSAELVKLTAEKKDLQEIQRRVADQELRLSQIERDISAESEKLTRLKKESATALARFEEFNQLLGMGVDEVLTKLLANPRETLLLIGQHAQHQLESDLDREDLARATMPQVPA